MYVHVYGYCSECVVLQTEHMIAKLEEVPGVRRFVSSEATPL